MARDKLRTVWEQDGTTQGRTIPFWASQLGMSSRYFVEACYSTRAQPQRWGNTVDLLNIAQECGIAVKVVDLRTRTIIAEHKQEFGKV
eukprot:4845987-Amphidinium_carterae.1